MAKLPYMRVYVPDLISDTYTLTDAEFGAYTRIVYALWRFKGSLAFDEKELAKIAGTTAKNWPKRWAKISRYFEIEGGRITQSRVTDELGKASKSGSGRGDNGIPGESNRSNKPLENNNPKSQTELGQKPELEPESESSTVVPFPLAQQAAQQNDWPDVEPRHLLDELARQVANPWLDPSKDVTAKLHRSAATYFPRWRASGCSWHFDILPQVAALCVNVGSQVISLKLFDGAVLDAQRARTAPAPAKFATSGDRNEQRLTSHNANYGRAQSGAQLANSLAGTGEPGSFWGD